MTWKSLGWRIARRVGAVFLVLAAAIGISFVALPTDIGSINANRFGFATYLFVVIAGSAALMLWAVRPLRGPRGLSGATPSPKGATDVNPVREFEPARLASVPVQAVELWHHYEEIAMHFNDLIMRWRLQAIGGLAALVTASGFVVGGAQDVGVRYRAMFLLSMTLLAGWIGVACIDLMYYRKLLAGAVDALLRLERHIPDIQLSTFIERHAFTGSKWAPRIFYVIGGLPLVMLISWAVYNILQDGSSAAATQRVLIDITDQ